MLSLSNNKKIIGIHSLEKVVKKIKNDMDLRVLEFKKKMGVRYPLLDNFTRLVNGVEEIRRSGPIYFIDENCNNN